MEAETLDINGLAVDIYFSNKEVLKMYAIGWIYTNSASILATGITHIEVDWRGGWLQRSIKPDEDFTIIGNGCLYREKPIV